MNLLKRHRLALGLTQHALGSRVGVTQGCVHRWESGRSLPHAKTFPKLAKVLGMDALKLTNLVSPEPNEKTPAVAG